MVLLKPLALSVIISFCPLFTFHYGSSQTCFSRFDIVAFTSIYIPLWFFSNTGIDRWCHELNQFTFHYGSSQTPCPTKPLFTNLHTLISVDLRITFNILNNHISKNPQKNTSTPVKSTHCRPPGIFTLLRVDRKSS